MKADAILENILLKLKSQFACHTVILYGSRARGDFTDQSDYDVAGFSEIVDEVTRDARKFRGKFVDAFIFPESELKKANESHLYMRGGVVLLEKDKKGTQFLKKLERLYSLGPSPLPKWERTLKTVWAEKMFQRAGTRDPEGHYRRLWLIASLLPDYFLLRGLWYRGSKLGLKDLQARDPKIYKSYLAALANPFDDKNLQALLRLIRSVN